MRRQACSCGPRRRCVGTCKGKPCACGAEHPGQRHLWSCAHTMTPKKAQHWQAFLAEAGVPYDVDRNLAPDWVVDTMHCPAPLSTRKAVLQALHEHGLDSDIAKRVRAVYRLARDLPTFDELLLEAIAR